MIAQPSSLWNALCGVLGVLLKLYRKRSHGFPSMGLSPESNLAL